MIDKIIQSRKSVKRFNSKKPDWRNIIECIDTMRFAPMAGNIFSLKFILIDDKKIIQEMAEAAEQPFIGNAHYIVAVCTNPSKTKMSYEERADIYLKQQAGAAIQNFLLKLTEHGLDTCWIGHFYEEKIKHLLKVPDDIHVEAFFPIGYEYKKTALKRKTELNSHLYFNEYNNKKMNPPKKINV